MAEGQSSEAGQSSHARRQSTQYPPVPSFHGHSRTTSAPSIGRFLTPAPDEDDDQARLRAPMPEAPPASPPPQRPMPSLIPRPTRSDPANPPRPQVVREWISIFSVRGRFGLQQAFYDYSRSRLGELPQDADERANARASWSHLLQDEKDKTNHVFNLLQTLPNPIILALLNGDLPLRMAQEPEIKKYVMKYMRLTDSPSIYLNLLYGGDRGFLSSDDMKKLLKKMEDYLVVSASPRVEQTETDNRLSPWNPKPDGPQLRGRENDRAAEIIQQWIDKAREIYCTDPTDPSTPFSLVPSEVGWANNPIDHCKRHMSDAGTTCIVGLLNAILRMPPPRGFGFPAPLQIVLFPIWERNKNLCQVSEITGSLITSAYWFLGGLNSYYAGGMTFTDDDPQGPQRPNPPASSEPCWDNNAQSFHSRLEYEKPGPEELEKFNSWNAMLIKAAKIDAIQATREGNDVERDRVANELKAKRAREEQLKKSIKDLEDKIAQERQKRDSGQPDESLGKAMQTLSLLEQRSIDSRADRRRRIEELLRRPKNP